MKTIKDLKNYVKSTSRLVMKDIVDMNSLYNASEWVIVLNMRNIRNVNKE